MTAVAVWASCRVSSMKTFVLFMAVIAMLLSGCTKEITATGLNNDAATASTALADVPALVPKVTLLKTGTNYSALIGAPDTTTDAYGFITTVAGELGVSCLRDKAPVPGTKKVQTLGSVYNILLNFTSTNPMPMNFRTDTTAYKTDLANTLSVFTTLPAVAVIENEESNTGYYSGSATDYINQLKAAITVMHAHGIPVADGGITSTGLAYWVYQDLLSRGLTTQAADYKTYMGIALTSSFTLDRANFVSILISNFTVMNLDYVNFHWRVKAPADSTYLGETISYLKRITKKKVMTNELGQYDQDPATVTAALQTCKNNKLSFVSWYSVPNTPSYPLQYYDQTLTASGVAYRNFISH